MSEELLQRDLIKNPAKIGKWDFYNIGATSVNALKKYGIIRNVDYGTIGKKKVDGIVMQEKNVIAVIEYKTPKEFKTKQQKNKAINQEIDVAQKLGAKIFIATDTKEAVWVNPFTKNRIKDWDGNHVVELFEPKSEKIVKLMEEIFDSISETNDHIKPRQLINPTDLAKSIWQDIWSVSGATPENCLYTFIELFIFKYLSDLGVLKGTHNFYTLIKMYKENTENEVLEHYADTVRKKIKSLFPENSIDKTTIINGTIFVSKDQKAVKGYSTTFKTVLDKFNKYGKLEYIDHDFKSKLFESFLKESISKKNWGQFFTPLKVVRSVVEMVKDDIKEGIKICDPACGVGKFLLEPVINRLDEFYKINKNGIKPKITIHGFDKGFDKDEQKTIILAKANMLIYFSDLIKENSEATKDFAELFNDSFILKTNSILGTLSEPVENEYDLILTNPPYVTSGSGNLKDEIKKDGDLMDYYKINAMGVEGLFMEWIVRALKPNGKAFIVIPDGILNRKNDKNIRQFIIDECFIDGIISLPLNTFFTTNKKTYILAITKKNNRKDKQKEPVFTYLVSEIGESRDIYRFDIDQNDLQEAVTLYSFFKGNKKGFKKINTDMRCKIQPFKKFADEIEESWIIDKWWNEKEKIKIGIAEKEKKVSLLEFASIIEDVANSIKEFQGEVSELSEKKNSKTKKIICKITDLFEIERGSSKYTKRYIDSHKGDYPVYSGNTFGSFAHINSFDYNNPCLSWAIDGLAGYIMVHNEKFSATNHRGILRPKDKDINLDYVKYVLEPIFRGAKKGRLGTDGKNEYTALPPFMIKDIEIEMPVDANGNFDIDFQNESVEKVFFINDSKQKIEEYKNYINSLHIDVQNNDRDSESLKIEDIFDLSIKTNNSKFTKTFIDKNKGGIPVYSASKFPKSVDYGYVKDSLKGIKYFENCLTWNIDGSIGKVHFRKGRFSLSEKVIPLIVKDNYKDSFDTLFLKYVIENEFSKYSFGFGNKAGKGRIKNIEISFPVKNGKIDLEKQKEIAKKYQKVEEIKLMIQSELDKISQTDTKI